MMEVLGVGIDAVEIQRFARAVDDWGESFLRKIFTPGELEYFDTKKAKPVSMAGKFAAKEAVKKALPDGASIGLRWYDIEILNGPDGKPYARLHGRAKKVAGVSGDLNVFVSVSHTRNIATANAVVVQNG